ncbi:hypothetical protein [Nocardia sp. NPDC051833]|uniref:hypothetical protein n=1 Tax=Nocardia sp. NPDC051833 TaxID=3155674 RepID=UPI0034161FA6
MRRRADLRLLGIAAVLLVAYLALRWVVTALSARQGFGSPDGLGPGFVVLAALAVGLRVVLLVVVPAVFVYRIATSALARLLPGDRTGDAGVAGDLGAGDQAVRPNSLR